MGAGQGVLPRALCVIGVCSSVDLALFPTASCITLVGPFSPLASQGPRPCRVLPSCTFCCIAPPGLPRPCLQLVDSDLLPYTLWQQRRDS